MILLGEGVAVEGLVALWVLFVGCGVGCLFLRREGEDGFADGGELGTDSEFVLVGRCGAWCAYFAGIEGGTPLGEIDVGMTAHFAVEGFE